MKDKHTKHFNLAKRLAKKSNHPRYQMSCVIVKGNTIISTGYNQLKTHPKSPHKWNMIHAEFAAVLGTPAAQLRGSTVYVYRELKNGESALAKPCKSCMKMLSDCEISRVFYSTANGYDSIEY